MKAATINGARALGGDEHLGSIETSKLADLFVVRGNPLDDISLLENVSFVMLGGKVLKAPGMPVSPKGMLLQ